MNWTKALLAGVVSGVVVNMVNYVIHGFIMAGAYAKYPIFDVAEPANPLHFFLVSICVAIAAALLFAKTRTVWAAGLMGGVNFGFWLGLVAFFAQFYNPMVLEGFPYYLSWCWGGIQLIDFMAYGAVLGAIYKK